MNWITKILRKREIKQCAISGVSICFSRRMYEKRKIPKLYFTVDYTIMQGVHYAKGGRYEEQEWEYNQMVILIRNGVLSEIEC